jgi:hypothetical protein
MKRIEVPTGFQRSRRWESERVQESAHALITDLLERVGRSDFSDMHILDVGCGVKFTQYLVNHEVPIGSYTGLDVYQLLIEFLRAEVTDPRFQFHHLNFHNARYNPGGVKMSTDQPLPLGDRTFDIICAYSLFTHLEPGDFRTMLTLLRRHARPDTRVFYTAFIDELTAGGHGLIDKYAQRFGAQLAGRTDGYRDFTPDDPLRQTLYTESYIRELTEGTGWLIEGIAEPTPYAQHLLTVRPV